MKESLFNELVTSLKEAGRIKRGTGKAARRRVLESVDVQAVREKMSLSQSAFALLIGVSVRTVQNWEQGRRQPQGPALALLNLFMNDPKHAVRALHG
ncbi:MAG: NadS family protein [Gammaproteobacteria bacterium]